MRKRSMAMLAAGATMSALAMTATPAAATDFWQAWGAGSYHASSDFVPTGGSVHIGGWTCTGGAARSFYVQLVKTSNSTGVFSSYSYAADGADHTDPRAIAVSTSTSYYLRWYGRNNSGQAASAPCSKAYATN
ncbi:hypothetical protein ABZ553_04285 [Streptomyces sparsogenes]|uniref:hypothetical protein n=1 Tax=Streptomyces sparsogenes TaxID=67365 RepID=UPI0033C09082